MAAGVTIRRERLDPFREYLNDALAPQVEIARESDALAVDGAVTGRSVSIELVRRVEKAGPFGQGNPEPVFVLPEQQVTNAMIAGANHLRLRLRSADGASIDAIAFRAMDTPLGESLFNGRGERFHIAARIGANHFRGVERAETRIIDAAPVR
jgi:single-stranded-DNA-specific exonuclease